MNNNLHVRRWSVIGSLVLSAASVAANADEMIKVGLSVPLSGSGAVWGRGSDWMCKKAAKEIKDSGGVKVRDTTYNFDCISYDNKYTAADGSKVAQTLLNRDGVKYIFGMGTAAILATQAMTERQGVLLFSTSWGTKSKGPKFPLTVSVVNSPVEIMPAMVAYVKKSFPQAKTVAILNVNDASGRESETTSRPIWEKAGLKIVTNDFYERGTTEFQPIAARLAAGQPDIIDLATAPPADAGQIFKELDTLGFKGLKISDNGTGRDGLVTTGGASANGVLMGAAIPMDGPSATDHQKKVNSEARAQLGESLALPPIGAYDAIYMLKAAIEKAGTIDPKQVASVLPQISYKTFYGGETHLAGRESYGSVIQPVLPVYITQIVNGEVVEKARLDPRKAN
ncbi:branched chain amino acid ABC transporter periplasmic ligand-binding protein [Caballeronia temeraria]|uniref:Branched chain amino acid ABC transporter periplasmic ligand-binding protein n=1 Tax=Caballeronia temeraria TaxID=1777137 RepID=A0A158DIQ6_9BURK|nr:ABC transporter substrate-binding protein [Caballeronia temeraria]SAK94468.1 branched chain amino acid ABC transporter periplasmic ligand-binding protein [Caballeronia temeraria]